MDFNGKNVTVIGLGISNMPLIRWLVKKGANVTARDKKQPNEIPEKLRELETLGIRCILGEEYLKDIEGDAVFCTPGLRPDVPEILRAKENGAVITSEMDQFFQLCPCKIIAITGSDGKTTTTTLVAKMLEKAGRRVHLGGNIGTPLLDKAEEMQADDFAVLELSSFQLMLLTKSANIALITNISPNHLDYHGEMEEYIQAKSRIFAYQKQGDRAIFNASNKISAELSKKAPADVSFFGPGGDVQVRDGGIFAGDKKIMDLSNILLPGAHNAENYCAACSVCLDYVPFDIMADIARTFPGVAHRLELVREKGGARYYNDSIGTSPTRTAAGLKCFDKKVILIAGGYDKKIPFDGLGADIVKYVKDVYLIGQTADKIKTAIENAPGYADSGIRITMCGDLKSAVPLTERAAQAGDVVMLSPACASYDQYANFEVRGNEFKELVNKL